MPKEKTLGVIKVDEKKCKGCFKCISVCPALHANVSYHTEEGKKIKVDPEKCINCGQCITACNHNARDYYDDTALFFEDLKNGEPLTIIVAPATRFTIEKLNKLFGFFKSKGVELIFDVSFGADICMWSLVKHTKENEPDSLIAQACPCIVTYIEKYLPSLIDKLAPIQSPAVCTAIYLRKYLDVKGKIAFLSPCISKLNEFNDNNTLNMIDYNVTYKKLNQYLKENKINLDDYQEHDFDNEPAGLGMINSKPGGLKNNLRRFLPDTFIRQVEGAQSPYSYLLEYKNRYENSSKLPGVVDILSCEKGCNLGTGSDCTLDIDEIDLRVYNTKIDQERIQLSKGNKSCKQFMKFEKTLNWKDFIRHYNDKSSLTKEREPGNFEYELIFRKLYKNDQQSRTINCLSCGYGSCRQFVRAIINGTTQVENCAYYNRKVVEIEKDKNEQIIKTLKELNEQKGHFLHFMSHELRTPLNGILGFSQSLELQYFGNLNDKQLEYVQQINNSGQHLLSLINDILDISKIESGTMNFEPETFSVNELFEDIMTSMITAFDSKKIMTNYIVERQLEKIYADKQKLKQVLYNLLSNAVKYTPEKGLIRVSAEKYPQNKVRILVKDTGIGIKNEDLHNIFKEFYQSDKRRDQAMGGTGLGLALCKKLIELHNGDIGVVSKYGQGSTFWFTLPSAG